MVSTRNNKDSMDWSDLNDGTTREIDTLFNLDFTSLATPTNYSSIDQSQTLTHCSQDERESTLKLYHFLKSVTEEFQTNQHNESEPLISIESSSQCLPYVRSQTTSSLPSPIALSPSVAISNEYCTQLQLVHPLEDFYRPRYKSDYFPQTNASRRPRYISDNVGHHYLELKIPPDYQHCSDQIFIRIALITICTEDQEHYYSPYKFQSDHDNIEVPDENPIYLALAANAKDRSRMKLFLVLIKSKLDQLNDVQPLKPFSDSTVHIRNILPNEKLGPKELITRYQLNKSQLAFTICTKLDDGNYKVYPQTTLISSVLTESSTAKRNNDDSPTAPVKTTRTLVCPCCSYSFSLSVSDEENQRLNNRKPVSRPRNQSTKKKNATLP